MVMPCEAKADTVVVDSQKTLTSSNSIYQNAGGGIAIRTGAALTFSDGGIMDYSSYHGALEKSGTIDIDIFSGKTSEKIFASTIDGDFTVDGGNLSGAIKLYKGHDTTLVKICTETGSCSNYPVSSAGDFRISGGDFRFTQNGEILMKATATGEFYLNNGNFYLSDKISALIGSEKGNNNLYVRGGTYDIAAGAELALRGLSISFKHDPKYTPFNFTGTGKLSFAGETTVDSGINWDTGTLELKSGTMAVNANVTVNSFTFSKAGGKLNVKKGTSLTVKSDFKMEGASTLEGEGELRLTNGANATFIGLDFGSIVANGTGESGKGELEFIGESTVDTIQINKGTLKVNANLSVTNLTLTDSVAEIQENLSVSNLNFDSGTIKYTKTGSSVTLNADSTITNDADFDTTAVNNGNLVINASRLDFTDKDNVSKKLSNAKLSIRAEKDAVVNFNQKQGVALNGLELLQATANFNTGSSSFNSIILGNANDATKGALNIASGAVLTANDFTSYFGSAINVEGVLALNGGTVNGTESAASTFTGAGTLKIGGQMTFNGRFENFGTLQLDGGAVFDFGGLSNNAVEKVHFTGTTDAVMNITNGIFTAGSLVFDDNSKGSINIAQNGTLALDAGGNDVSSIIHGTGSIGGEGTLRLVNNTSVSFGGNDKIKDLGTLEIGNGTATISGEITIGNVKFYQETGTLNISDGKTLSLKTITTDKSNKVTGEGTLKLTGSEKSTFGGIVSGLGKLEFASGDVEFSNAGVSTVGTITGNGGDLTVNGTLNVANGLTVNNGTVSGGGFLNLVNGGTFAANGALRLTAGGNVSLTDTSVVKDLTALENAKINIANGKNLTVSGTLSTAAGSALTGGELILEETGTFAANAAQVGMLTVQNGAKATFAGDNSLTKLSMLGNASAVINAGATLTLAQDSVGEANSVITGAGTLALNKSGMTVNSKLSDLGGLSVLQSATLSGTAQVGTLNIANGTLTQNSDVTAGTVSFDSNGKLTVNDGKTLTVTQNIAAASNTLNGTGTINLAGGANGSFATGDSFAYGHLIIGSGTASFTGNTSMASVAFAGNNGTLFVGEGNTLTLASIKTKASNVLTGKGTLKLTGTGSMFDAPIASLGKLNIAEGGASFSQSANIGTVAFDNGGTLTVGGGAVLTAANLTQNGTLGTVSGAGAFRIGAGTADFTTGGNSIGGLYIGSGTLNVKSNSKAGKVVFDDKNGTLNVEAGKTLTVSDALTASGTVGGNGALVLENGGRFDKALTFGTITTGAGVLTFYEDAKLDTVDVGNGSAYFRKGAAVSNLKLTAGETFFNGENTNIGKLEMSGAGKVTFNQNASITNGASIGGTLDIGVTHLNVENGLTFTDNSSLHLRLKAAATDDLGKIVDDNAYGKINVGSGSITIGNNVNLDLTIDYGLHTAADGTEFNLISGSTASGAFTFANSRYKLEAVSCSSGSGLCYKLKETSNAEEIVQEEKGSQNNQNTAAAVLDGGLFNETDKMFAVASHLDALSQKRGGGRAYLNALTALAPDVSGAVTGQSVLTQTRVSKSVFNRLGGLQKRMGNRSEKYRKMRELYGRSGGSAYNSGLMRSADYYKKAGYYDMPAKRAYPSYEAQGRITPREYDYEPRNGKTYPAYETKGRMPSERRSYDDFDNQPKRKVAKYRSQRQADYGAFYGARPSVGVWAQGLYNTNEYKSASKEDGFSADSTGVSMGLDVIFADVAAIGFGYARTTSDLSALQRSTDVTGDTFFLYGMYKPANWYLSGIVSSGKNTFEEQKDLSGLTVSDNYDTKTIGGQLMLGFDTKGWSPAFGLRYSSVSRAAHEDSVGQKIASFSNSVFSAVAETQKTFELSRAGKGVWSSDLSAGLVYDFSRSEDEATVSLTNGASYTVKGSDMDPYGAELGAGISYVWGSSVDLSARYNLDVRPEWFSHTLTATLRVTF